MPTMPNDADLHYELIAQTGRVAEASSQLVAAVQKVGEACPLCGAVRASRRVQQEDHDTDCPCGELLREIIELSAVVRQLTAAARGRS